MIIHLYKSDKPLKKYKVVIDGKTVYFGAAGYQDYTIHKDPDRKARYINRHKNNENWKKSGITTPGFWSRWLLWGEPTIGASIKAIQDKFGVKIIRKR